MQLNSVIPVPLEVRALLDHSKSQFRVAAVSGEVELQRCRLGDAGDLLWVKEAYRLWGEGPSSSIATCIYAADGEARVLEACDISPENPGGDLVDCRWFSAEEMPLWASRLILEIESVRLDRRKDIVALESDHCTDANQGWVANDLVWVVEVRRVDRKRLRDYAWQLEASVDALEVELSQRALGA